MQNDNNTKDGANTQSYLALLQEVAGFPHFSQDGVYSQTRKLLADDVDMFRTLRLSALWRWMQEISIAHTEALGQGRAKTLDKGALWILARQRVVIKRMPRYDEVVTLSTWASDTMHMLFPRNYMLLGSDGEVLMQGSAIWVLMQADTRKIAFPDDFGVEIEGVTTGNEISLPTVVAPCSVDGAFSTEVEFSQVDINTHMNNAKYLDLMQDLLGADYLSTHTLSRLDIEYKHEARLGERLDVRYGTARDGATATPNENATAKTATPATTATAKTATPTATATEETATPTATATAKTATAKGVVPSTTATEENLFFFGAVGGVDCFNLSAVFN